MRYLNDKDLTVGLPIAFSISEYLRNIDGYCTDSSISDDPTKLNKIFLKMEHTDELREPELRIYYNNKQDLFQFTYLIDGIIIHQYTDIITYRDNAIHELVRTVDDRYRYYCWETIDTICYQRVPIYKP